QSEANARQRALELMEQHAEVCGQVTPVNGFGQPPLAGATASGARPAASAEPGGPTGRVRTAGGRSTGTPTIRTPARGAATAEEPTAGIPGEVDSARPVRAIHADPRADADASRGPSYLSERNMHGFPAGRETPVLDPVVASAGPVPDGRSRY